MDLSHSQPFWAHGVPDLATVHNGHITNYHRLRRLYEQQGVRFFTENDSEVIGVYLRRPAGAGRLARRRRSRSLDDLDGCFTYLVATPDGIGFARDPFALKPLIVVETDDYVAIANEEVAIRAALGDAGVAHEPTRPRLPALERRAPTAVAGVPAPTHDDEPDRRATAPSTAGGRLDPRRSTARSARALAAGPRRRVVEPPGRAAQPRRRAAAPVRVDVRRAASATTAAA